MLYLPLPDGKVCTKCKQQFPTAFFYKRSNRKSGLLSACISCCSKATKHMVEVERGLKFCHKCEQAFPATTEHFSPDKNGRYGLTSYCKACNREKNRQRRASKPEKTPEKTPESLDRQRAASRKYHHSHPEQMRLQYRNRKARKKGAEGSFSPNDIRLLYKAQQGRCAYCSIELGETYHIDHVFPLSRGGSNWPDNLALACARCNLQKANRMLWDEWIPPDPFTKPE